MFTFVSATGTPQSPWAVFAIWVIIIDSTCKNILSWIWLLPPLCNSMKTILFVCVWQCWVIGTLGFPMEAYWFLYVYLFEYPIDSPMGSCVCSVNPVLLFYGATVNVLWVPCQSLLASYWCAMDSLWKPIDFVMYIIWISYKFPYGILWVFYESSIGFIQSNVSSQWILDGSLLISHWFPMDSPCKPVKFVMNILLASNGFTMDDHRVCDGHPVELLRIPLRSHISVLWI